MSPAPKGFIEVFVTLGPGYGGYERNVRLSDIAGTKASDMPNINSGLILADGQVLWVSGTLSELNRKINAAHADAREPAPADTDLIERLEDLERRVADLEARLPPEGSDHA